MTTYEVHITIEPNEFTFKEAQLRVYAKERDLGFSKIAGWDELGEGARWYLTWHREAHDAVLLGDNERIGGGIEDVKRELHERIADLLILGFNVMRGKIETCAYDWRR